MKPRKTNVDKTRDALATLDAGTLAELRKTYQSTVSHYPEDATLIRLVDEELARRQLRLPNMEETTQ